MKPDTEIVDRAAFLRALAGKPAKPHASRASARKAPRAQNEPPSLTAPRSEPGEGDRHGALGRIAVYHFSPRYRAGIGHDFWHVDGRTTTPHARYADAVQAAEKELR